MDEKISIIGTAILTIWKTLGNLAEHAVATTIQINALKEAIEQLKADMPAEIKDS